MSKKEYLKLKCVINHYDINDLNDEQLSISITKALRTCGEIEIYTIGKAYYNFKKNWVTDVKIDKEYQNIYCDQMIAKYIEKRKISLNFMTDNPVENYIL